MIVCVDGLEDEDEILSKENLEAFCSGLSHNRSLRFLMMEDFDFDRARMEILRPFVVENYNLTDLRLHSCGVDNQDIQMLSNAFCLRSTPSSIKSIAITGPIINNESVQGIVELSNNCPHLKKLDLSYSRIRDQGCNELAVLLQNPESKLKCLHLNDNYIGNEGALVLANAIAGNNTLKRLDLDHSLGDAITASEWDGFLGILCNSSSINATFQSNHTLMRMWHHRFHLDGMGLSDGLLFSLQANTETDKINVARQKIFRCDLNGNFNLAPFLGMDAVLIPTVLGWIGKDHDANEEEIKQSSGSAFYRILRNVPELCGLPLPERKMRRQLEEENATLKADNASLRQQNEQLISENEQLRSSKRQRNH